MPRNASGTYTLPESAFVPGTVISSTAVNSDFSDIATALTDSLSRSGDGGMTAALQMDPTGFVYSNDPDTGMLRTAANTQAIKAGGSNILTVNTAGINVVGTITRNSNSLLPIGLGPVPFSGTVAPPYWILCYGQTLLRASYPDLWAFAEAEIALGNPFYNSGDGTTTFGVADLRGRGIFFADNMGGSAANRLTSTYFGTAATLGATGGTQSTTLLHANLPNVTLTTNITDPGHAHVTTNASRYAGSTFATGAGGADFSVPINASSNNLTGINTGNAATGITASTPLGGSGTAISRIPPGAIANAIIYAGA